MRIRRLQPDDEPAVQTLRQGAYTDLLRERSETVSNKRALFPEGALGCFMGLELWGYALTVPWRAGELVPRDRLLQGLPANPDVLVVHDLIVEKQHRGRGVGRCLMDEVQWLAEHLRIPSLEVVSLPNLTAFWRHLGFEVMEPVEYAPGMTGFRMVKTLRPAPSGA